MKDLDFEVDAGDKHRTYATIDYGQQKTEIKFYSTEVIIYRIGNLPFVLW